MQFIAAYSYESYKIKLNKSCNKIYKNLYKRQILWSWNDLSMEYELIIYLCILSTRYLYVIYLYL